MTGSREEMTAHASTPEPGDADDLDLTDSDLDTAGDMGVSSEREGPTGPGQWGTTGVRDVGPADDEAEPGDVPPEQRPGGVEPNSGTTPPKGGYPSADPRSG